MNAGDSEANEMGGVVFRFNMLDSGLSQTLVTARQMRQPALCLNQGAGFDVLGLRLGSTCWVLSIHECR